VDLVEEGVTGLLYKPEDAKKFLACVKSLATDLKKAKKMGEAGQKKARQYAWETTLDYLLEVYADVVTKSMKAQKPKRPTKAKKRAKAK
jgi:glycosyltransferase involved in cell wall biosynthesis